jgi:hypothetical protein
MALKLSERAHVADALTGRRHGQVKAVVDKGLLLLVEWSDGMKSEHKVEDLVARYTVQSPEYGRVF